MLGHFRLWPPSLTDLHIISCWYRSDATQDGLNLSQAALLLTSKVRGYDPVCSKWSAKKTRESQLKNNKTYRTHLFNLLLLLVFMINWYFVLSRSVCNCINTKMFEYDWLLKSLIQWLNCCFRSKQKFGFIKRVDKR